MHACLLSGSLTICNCGLLAHLCVFSPSCVRLCDTMDCSIPEASISAHYSWVVVHWHPKRDSKINWVNLQGEVRQVLREPDKFRDEFVRL